MKILYISYDGMTDPLGQSQVIPYLAGLSKKGHTITIISCEKKDRFLAQSAAIRKLLDDNNINWEPVPYSRMPSVLSKQFNLSLINKKAQRICKEQRPDAVHCRSYMAALIGLKLKKKYHTKFIFDMRGFWADERIDGKIWNLKNALHRHIYRFFKKKEIEFLSAADHTISLTQNAKDEILSWKPFVHKEIPITVIPCCADLALFSQENVDPAQVKKTAGRLKLTESDFVISYLGSIGTWYMLDEMLDFFKRLLLKKANAKFLFITPDAPDHILQAAAQKGIPARQLVIVSAGRKEVPMYLSLSALSVYFIKPLYSKKASSPTKTAEIMGMGIPLITNTGIGDSDLILQGSSAGLLINAFENGEYDRVIEQIDVLLKTDKSRIIQTSRDHFSLEKGVELYERAYQQLN